MFVDVSSFFLKSIQIKIYVINNAIPFEQSFGNILISILKMELPKSDLQAVITRGFHCDPFRE